MRKAILLTIFLLSFGFTASCGMLAQERAGSVDRLSEEIIAIERSALDRWITGDPQGYLDLFAPEVTYFDPTRERRVDGLEAMKTALGPVKNLKGAIKDPRYEMIAPKVQRHGDVALLSFNLLTLSLVDGYGSVAPAPGKRVAVRRAFQEGRFV